MGKMTALYTQLQAKITRQAKSYMSHLKEKWGSPKTLLTLLEIQIN